MKIKINVFVLQSLHIGMENIVFLAIYLNISIQLHKDASSVPKIHFMMLMQDHA